MNPIVLILAIAIPLLIVVIYFIYNKGRNALVREAKARYDAALKSGNKSAALKAGREYYSTLRGGTLSIYDEQAISNDISTM